MRTRTRTERSVACGAHHRLLFGIGEATASRLAKAGWTVYATARTAETLAASRPPAAATLALDVDDEASAWSRRSTPSSRPRAPSACSSTTPATASPAPSSRSPIDKVRAPVRDQRLRPAAPVPARAARHARAGLGQDRATRLDGREAHLPRRRRLPRDQARAGGALRRAALRDRGLRHRRGPDRAGPHQDRLRDDGGARPGRRPRAKGPMWSSTAPSAKPRATSTRRACWPSSAARPRPTPSAIEMR